MMSSRTQRSVRLHLQALLCLSVVLLSPSVALAGSAGILPFSASKGVPNGAAENIASLVSTEIDIRGGYDLVISASSDEVASGCGERSACVDEYGNENDFVHVITGSVSTAGAKRYTLVLTLYKVGSASAIRQVLNTLDRSPDALLDGIPDLVVELLTGQRPVHEEDKPQDSAKGSSKLFSDGDDFSDSADPSDNDELQESEEQDERKWMERDRHGRLTQPVDGEEDPLGLDEIDDLDLDLDELSTDHQSKKRKQRGEREAAARAALAEEERLAQVAKEERNRRMREREIRERERQRDEQRLEEQEQRRIAEERQRRRQDEQRRSRDEQRREQEREQAQEERRREEQRELRARERREEKDRERERDRERQRERERREAEELDREERDRRSARARFEEDQRAEERRRREERDRDRRDREERYDEDEEDITLDAGIIIIESDDEDEEGEDESGGFGILIEEDSDEDEEPDYNRGEDRDYDRDLDEREDFNIDQRRDERSRRDRRDQKPRGGYGSSRNERSRETRATDYDLDRNERSRIRPSRADSKREEPRKSGRPPGSIHAFVGYNYYYLSFLRAGVEGNIYVLPALSLDFSVEAWMLWLREGEDLRLAARVLPNFLVGASYRMSFHPVVKPFVGGDVGTVIYAQKVEVSESQVIAKTPLFALVIAAKGGCQFDLPKNFGLFVTARVGVSISGDLEQDGLADIQQYVNETWSPTRVFFNIGAGALYRF